MFLRLRRNGGGPGTADFLLFCSLQDDARFVLGGAWGHNQMRKKKLSLNKIVYTYDVKSIKEGGSARVYKAWCKNPEGRWYQFGNRSVVALKILKDRSKSLEREITSLKQLDHPHIITLKDGGTTLTDDGEVSCLVMEYIEGVDLKTYCHGKSMSDRLKLMIQVIEAVHYAHEQKIIHRDLKPTNILVDSEGKPCIPGFWDCESPI